MAMRSVILLGLCLALAACGSRLNPFNWFGNSEDTTIEVVEDVDTDPRGLVDQVVRLTVDPLPSGAVVTAVGLPDRQGFWEADLVEVERAEGRIVYEFRILPPIGTTAQGVPRSREIVTATDLSNQDLAEIRTIVVQGARNQLTSRR